MKQINIHGHAINLHDRKIFPGQVYGRFEKTICLPYYDECGFLQVSSQKYNLTYVLEYDKKKGVPIFENGYFTVSFWVYGKGWLHPCSLKRNYETKVDHKFSIACDLLNTMLKKYFFKHGMKRADFSPSKRELRQKAYDCKMQEVRRIHKTIDRPMNNSPMILKGRPGYVTNPHVISDTPTVGTAWNYTKDQLTNSDPAWQGRPE